MKRRICSVSAVVVSLALVLLVWAGPAAAAEKGPIKIGILGPFTGALAFNAGEMKKGMELALGEVNSKGGLFGRKIELIYADTEAKPDKGVAAIKKLITRDEVLVVGGGYASSVNIATSEVADAEKTPNVVAIAISPTITNRGLKYVFRTSPNSPMFLTGMNKWLEEVKKPKTVAFFMENTDYGRDGEKIWSEVSKKIGAKELAHLYYEIGDTDFTTQISKLKELKPDVTFCIGSTTEQTLIQKQAKELTFVTQWIGVGGHFTEAFFKMSGAMCEFAMGSSLEPTLNLKNPETAAFVKAYEAKNPGARPGIFSSQGYDNVMVIVDAIKRAGEPSGKLQQDRDKIRDALKATDIRLSQGLIKFDQTGQVVTLIPSAVQVQLKDCKPELRIVFPKELATAEYQAPIPWDQRKCK
ncbi:MAG: ABC transporter substrate-binding protein [Thermodesulfobacteriota bacterium]